MLLGWPAFPKGKAPDRFDDGFARPFATSASPSQALKRSFVEFGV